MAVDFSSGKLNIKFDDNWSMGGLATKGMFQREKIMAGQPPTPRVTKLPGLITHFNQEKPTVHKAGYFWWGGRLLGQLLFGKVFTNIHIEKYLLRFVRCPDISHRMCLFCGVQQRPSFSPHLGVLPRWVTLRHGWRSKFFRRKVPSLFVKKKWRCPGSRRVASLPPVFFKNYTSSGKILTGRWLENGPTNEWSRCMDPIQDGGFSSLLCFVYRRVMFPNLEDVAKPPNLQNNGVSLANLPTFL